MSSLRLQGRGALVVLAAWAALAVAQAQQPAPPAATAKSAPERFVTLTENGKTVRCRLVQSWKLQDGSTAHKLQAVESGEFITILDDPTATPTSKGMSKRIFHWGLKNLTSPPGIPAPPSPESTGIRTVQASQPQGSALVPFSAVLSGPASPYQVGAPTGPFGILPAASGPALSGPALSGPALSGPPIAPAASVLTVSGPAAMSGPALSGPAGNGPVVSTAMPCDSCTTMGPCTSGCNTCDARMTLRERIQSWFANRNASVYSSEPKVVSICSPEPKVASVSTVQPKVASVSSAEPKTVVLPSDTKAPSTPLPRLPEKTLAITESPSSSQPARMEVVAALTPNDIAKDWNRPAVGAAAPPSAVVPVVAPPSTVAPVIAPPSVVAPVIAPPSAVVPVIALPSTPIVQVVQAKPDVITTPECCVAAEKPKSKTVAVAQPTPEKQEFSMPPGAASVIAARNGLDGPIAYVPVQTPVVPKPWRAPVPPDPKTPEAPQLNAYVNAFSMPAQPRGPDAPQVYGPGPQAMPYGPMMANGYPPQGMMPPYAMSNPYGMPPQAMMNPYGMPQGMPYGYGYPVMQSGYPMMPMQQQPPQTMGPRQYQGPMPPNPVPNNAAAMGIQPIAYAQPMMPYYQPGVMPVSAFQPALAPTPQFAQFIDKLHDSPFPAEREQAVYQLTGFDWRAYPQIAAALVRGAAQDPAPTVRVGCVMTLMRMNVATQPVMGVLQNLRTDADPRVRDAAEQAIFRLGQVRTAQAN